jgi:hypothetical protein
LSVTVSAIQAELLDRCSSSQLGIGMGVWIIMYGRKKVPECNVYLQNHKSYHTHTPYICFT